MCRTEQRGYDEQWLVRFRDRTHVVLIPGSTHRHGNNESLDDDDDDDDDDNNNNHNNQNFCAVAFVKSFLSSQTGWPSSRLSVVNWDPPFITVRVVSGIVGGKGGFGTLLKGQSRQAGANTTTNFGACRDLQGRRLRHVNEALESRLWQQWREKVEAGVATEADMAKALLDTDSGVVGWHLQIPAWADVSSKKEQRKWRRKFFAWKREQEAAQSFAEEKRRQKEWQLEAYIKNAEAANEHAQKSVKNALEEALRDKERESKRAKIEPDPPTALLSLAGDATLAYSEKDKWQIQSHSNFCTVGIILRNVEIPVLYYEITVVTGGLVQVGWATPLFRPSSQSGDGVGDCAFSWSYDGSRSIRLHASKNESYGSKWKSGDVVGCTYDIASGVLSYTLNGIDMGIAYDISKDLSGDKALYPAISSNPEEIVELHLYENNMKYAPVGSSAVGHFLAEQEDEISLAGNEADQSERSDSDEESKVKGVEKIENQWIDRKETLSTENKPLDQQKRGPVVVEPLNLDEFSSVEELEQLGLDRLKGALMAIDVKCGGTLHERATRLFSLKGLQRKDYPKKLLAKK